MKNKATYVTKGDREMELTREFNAPPELVFEAWTEAKHVRKWWAPLALGVSVVSIEADVRVGGKYRYEFKPGEAPQFAFSGQYLEVTPPKRLVYTQLYEPVPGSEVVITVDFEARPGGKTFVRSVEKYPSNEVRTMALSTGMETGALMTMDQLDELVSAMR